MLHTLKVLWQGFLHLLYPDLCVACQRDAPSPGACFCMPCRLKLMPSDMHLQQENEFTQRFWGRLPLEAGASMYYFTRKSPIQRALHQLKYHNKPEIGLKLGRAYGIALRKSGLYDTVDVVLPVPLHPKKERLRGYNQSAQFAQGIGQALGKPVLERALQRVQHSASQTGKKRLERFDNVGEVFALKNPALLRGKHVLLVDDVLTTGATLEYCGQCILKAPGARLSLATIAIAVN